MKLNNTKKIRSLAGLAFAIAVGAQLSTATWSNAQDTTPAPSESSSSTLDTMIVTGTYIPTAESEGALPVAVYTKEDIQKMGSDTIAQGLRHLPSYSGSATGQTENDNNGGDGSAFLNLRGLGSENVLVLLNGRRAGAFTNLNQIPESLIDHVEILKDGASATYGADAVSGVANFILKPDFEGTEISALYGNTTNNDAGVAHFSVISGTKTDKLSIYAGAEYYKRNSIESTDRYLSSLSNRRALGGNVSSSSSSTFPGRASSDSRGNLILINPAGVPTSLDDYRPFNASTDSLNTLAFTPVSPRLDRNQFYTHADYKILGDKLVLYSDVLYSQNNFHAALAPAPFALFAGSPADGGNNIDISPYNPAPGDISFVRYRSFPLGNRELDFQDEAYHIVTGLKGKINDNWNWDIGWLYDDEHEVETDKGDLRLSTLTDAITNGTFNPFIGVMAPQQGTLNGSSWDNVAALNAAAVPEEISKTDARTWLLDGKISGTAFTDAVQGGLDLAAGFEYREDSYAVAPDPVQESGDTAGFNALGGYNGSDVVTAFFGEMRVPIVTPEMKVPFVYNLDVDVALRYESYTYNGLDPVSIAAGTPTNATPRFETTNPKFAVRYQPIADLTFRGSYSSAFRAPTITETFATASQDFPEISDPLAPDPNAATYQPVNGTVSGGATDLKPETTDTYTAGVVYTPSYLKGFTITLDYYQVYQNDLISSGSDAAQFIINTNAATGAFANRVIRDSGGQITQVNASPFNIASRNVEGIDVTAIYTIPTEKCGTFTLGVAYNHIFTYTVKTSATDPEIDFNGNFSSAPFTPGSIPFNKGYVSLEWAKGGWDVNAIVNYIGDYMDDPSAVTTDSVTGLPHARNVREWTTLDMQVSYEFKAPEAVEGTNSYSKDGKTVVSSSSYKPGVWATLLGGTKIRAGVTNVFDEAPPFVAGAFNGNYDTALSDIRGRYYYIGVTKKF